MTEYKIKTGDINVRISVIRVMDTIKANTYANDDAPTVAAALAILDSIGKGTNEKFGVLTSIATVVDGVMPDEDNDDIILTDVLTDMNAAAGLIERIAP